MKYFFISVTVLVTIFAVSLFGLNFAMAATAPDLGDAESFSILGAAAMSSANITTVSGNLGLSPGLGVSKTGVWAVGGTEYFGTGGLSQSAQADALSAFNNLVAQLSSGSWGTSPWSPLPGVWTDASSPVFNGTITLDGDYDDVWIFKISTDFTFTGSVILAGNAQACNVFWSVAGDATIGAGSNFVGTLIAQNDITSASGSTINGRIISLSGTTIAMNGADSTISGPTCNVAPVVTSANLHVIKNVINDDGRTLTASDFLISVKLDGNNVTGSPAIGVEAPGTLYTLSPGNYVVSEIVTTTYTQTFSGDCDASGNIVLASGDNKTCIITNDDVAPVVLPTTSTITVIKVVVNDNGRTKVVADFPLFVNGNPVVSGVPTVFPSPGTYTVTETVDPNYTYSFSVDCDADGNVVLASGEDKICIITNDDKALPSSGGGFSASPPVPPLINVVKTASPLSLPTGPGPVTYTYTLSNVGTVPVTNITMVGDTCSPINLISGDINGDGKLGVNETWIYRCSTTINETHTNTIVATGWANGISAIDIASATVVVGVPVIPPLINITKSPSPLTLPFGGGLVTYTMKVTNPGEVALRNVVVTDDKCSSLSYISGDLNNNSQLDVGETWIYTCQANLTQTITNTVTAKGEANGLTARDIAVATVVVASAVVPTLPKTGFSSYDIVLGLIGLIAIIVIMAIIMVVVLRKKIT